MLSFETIRGSIMQAAAHDPDAPADLVEEMRVLGGEPVSHPVYLFQIDWTADATASIGYDRTEHYTAYRSVWDSTLKRSRQEPYTATRTVTDWHPFSNNYSGSFVMRYPAAGVSDLERAAILSFSVGESAGHETSRVELSANEAASQLRVEAEQLVRARVIAQLPGTKRRDIRVNPTLRFQHRLAHVQLYSCEIDYKSSRIPCVASATNASELLVNFPKSAEVIKFRRSRAATAWLHVIVAALVSVGIAVALPTTGLSVSPWLVISGWLVAVSLTWAIADGLKVGAIRRHIEDSFNQRGEALARMGESSPVGNSREEAQRAVKGRPFLKSVLLLLSVSTFAVSLNSDLVPQRVEPSSPMAAYYSAERSPGDRRIGEPQEEKPPLLEETQEAVVDDASMILPQSSVRLLAADELATLSAHQIRIARNEIFARRGRRFSDPEIRAYFEKLDWYRPTTDEVQLNDVEAENVRLLTQAERDLVGSEGQALPSSEAESSQAELPTGDGPPITNVYGLIVRRATAEELALVGTSRPAGLVIVDVGTDSLWFGAREGDPPPSIGDVIISGIGGGIWDEPAEFLRYANRARGSETARRLGQTSFRVCVDARRVAERGRATFCADVPL